MRRLSELEKAEIWDRFEAGESQRSISRRLGRSPSSIRTHLLGSGFRRPVPGPEWSSLRLSLIEREEISRGLAATVRCLVIGKETFSWEPDRPRSGLWWNAGPVM